MESEGGREGEREGGRGEREGGVESEGDEEIVFNSSS